MFREMIIRASHLPRLKIIRQFSVVGDASVKRQPVLKKGVGNRFKRLNEFATDENMFQVYGEIQVNFPGKSTEKIRKLLKTLTLKVMNPVDKITLKVLNSQKTFNPTNIFNPPKID